MIYHCLSTWKTGIYVNLKDFIHISGISRCMLTPYSLTIYIDKKGPWLRQLNTLEVMDTDIQQLLIEDL
jgi:hypothetical protein